MCIRDRGREEGLLLQQQWRDADRLAAKRRQMVFPRIERCDEDRLAVGQRKMVLSRYRRADDCLLYTSVIDQRPEEIFLDIAQDRAAELNGRHDIEQITLHQDDIC